MILSFTLLALVACGGDGDNIIVERNTQKPSATVVNNNRNTTGPKAAQTRYEFPKLRKATARSLCTNVHSTTRPAKRVSTTAWSGTTTDALRAGYAIRCMPA